MIFLIHNKYEKNDIAIFRNCLINEYRKKFNEKSSEKSENAKT